jgi:tetratricopeptide (TPR) repeat protein
MMSPSRSGGDLVSRPAAARASAAPVDDETIERELGRILASPSFASSERLKRFLSFIVEETVAGRAETLKEYTVGVRVYDRGDGFDPRADSIVRTEASRLRMRLSEYYASPGTETGLRIELPKGSYVPIFTPSAPPGIPEPSVTPRPTAAARRSTLESRAPRKTVLAGLLLVAVLLTALPWALQTRQAFDLEPGTWVLVAALENQTGHELPEAALETALEMELARSRSIIVVPRPRVDDTLRLMRKPAGMRVPGDLAREVALRDGGVRLIVAGTIGGGPGGPYSLWLQLRAVDGVSRYTGEATAADRDGLIDAIRRGAADLRRAVGDLAEDTQVSGRSLEPATTSSLAALQLYSDGMALVHEGKWAAAEQLLQRAVDLDPDFASAAIYLAHSIRNQGRPPAAWRPYADLAVAASAQSTDVERLFILGSAAGMNGDHHTAAGHYTALLQLQPDHYWAVNNLALTSPDPAQGAVLLQRRADLRPNDFRTNLSAVEATSAGYRNRKPSDVYRDRARKAAEREDPVFALDMLEAFEGWSGGKPESLVQTFERVRTANEAHAPGARVYWVGLTALGLGRLRAFEALAPAFTYPGTRERWLVWSDALRGRSDRAAAHAEGLAAGRPNPLSAIGLVRLGRLAQAKAMLERPAEAIVPMARAEDVHAVWEVAWAEYLRARGQSGRAVALFDSAIHTLRDSAFAERFIALHERAILAEAAGDVGLARVLLAEAVAARALAFPQALYFWVQCAEHLARLERQLGHTDAAAALEHELGILLAGADGDARLAAR